MENTFPSSIQHGSGEDEFAVRSEGKLSAKLSAFNWTMINQGPVPPSLPQGRFWAWKMTSPGQGSRVATDGFLFQSQLAQGWHTPTPEPPSLRGTLWFPV